MLPADDAQEGDMMPVMQRQFSSGIEARMDGSIRARIAGEEFDERVLLDALADCARPRSRISDLL